MRAPASGVAAKAVTAAIVMTIESKVIFIAISRS